MVKVNVCNIEKIIDPLYKYNFIYQLARKDFGFKVLIAPKHDSTYSNFIDFINDYDKTIKFIRDILEFIEKDLETKDYHLCILPPPFSEGKHHSFYEPINDQMKEAMIKCGFVVSVTNDGIFRNPPIDAPELLDLSLPIKFKSETVSVDSNVISRDLLLFEDSDTGMRCVLDAGCRPCFVIVPRFHVSILSSLLDDQLYSIFVLLKKVLTKYTDKEYTRIIVNAGNYMNVSHLHMKIFVDPIIFKKHFGNHIPLINLRKCVFPCKRK